MTLRASPLSISNFRGSRGAASDWRRKAPGSPEGAVHPHRVHPGRLVGDLGHVVVPLHRGLGVDVGGLGGVEVIHPHAHRVVTGALEGGAAGWSRRPSRPIPIPRSCNSTGRGPRRRHRQDRAATSKRHVRRIIVNLPARPPGAARPYRHLSRNARPIIQRRSAGAEGGAARMPPRRSIASDAGATAIRASSASGDQHRPEADLARADAVERRVDLGHRERLDQRPDAGPGGEIEHLGDVGRAAGQPPLTERSASSGTIGSRRSDGGSPTRTSRPWWPQGRDVIVPGDVRRDGRDDEVERAGRLLQVVRPAGGDEPGGPELPRVVVLGVAATRWPSPRSPSSPETARPGAPARRCRARPSASSGLDPVLHHRREYGRPGGTSAARPLGRDRVGDRHGEPSAWQRTDSAQPPAVAARSSAAPGASPSSPGAPLAMPARAAMPADADPLADLRVVDLRRRPPRRRPPPHGPGTSG